jgi:hypothetical protein
MNTQHQSNLGWLQLLVDVRDKKYCVGCPCGMVMWVFVILAIVYLTKCF